MATAIGQSACAGEPNVCAVGTGGVKRLEPLLSVSSSRYHGVVESVQHDSPERRLLWACRAPAMASFGA